MKTTLLVRTFFFFAVSIAPPAFLQVSAQSGGSVDLSFNPATGPAATIYSILLQADGKQVIGGSFTAATGGPGNYLARLNADGSRDATFDSGSVINGEVYAITAQADGELLIGGAANGTSGGSLFRLDTNGGLDSNFHPIALDQAVMGITVQTDGKIIVGGGFSRYLVRLNADGSKDNSFDIAVGDFDGQVLSTAVQADGQVLIGGYFTTVKGNYRQGIARLNTNGSLDTSFNPHHDNYNAFYGKSISIQTDGKVLVCGSVGGSGKFSAFPIKRLNTNGTLDSTFANPGILDEIQTLALQADGNVLIGGYFAFGPGRTNRGIGRLSANGVLDPGFNPGPGAINVKSIAVQKDGKVLIGGTFTVINGVPRLSMARLEARDLLLSPASVPENSPFGTVVGNLTMNPNSSGPYTFALIGGAGAGDNAAFSILGNTLYTAGALDFETKSSYGIRVQAMDSAGSGFEKALTISILNANDPPVVSVPLLNQFGASGVPFAYTIPQTTFTDADPGQSLVYTASGLPPGLTFDGAARTFSGVVNLAGAFPITVIATDNGAPALSVSAFFTLTINGAPELSSPLLNQTASFGVPFSYTFPQTTFTDSDVGQSLTYAASGLPPGITFDSVTGTFSGVPSVLGVYPVTVTATDNGNPALSTTGALTFTINYPVPTITMQPTGLSLFEQQDGILTVAATGGALNYQWQKDGVNIAGATSPNLVLTEVHDYADGQYTVTVSNPSGAITSSPAHLAILPPVYLQNIADSLGSEIASRAAQSSLASLQTSIVSSINSSLGSGSSFSLASANLDTNVLSRASQASLDNLTTNSLMTLTSNALTRSSQTSVDNANSALAAANAKLDSLSSTAATEASVMNANGFLASASGKLDTLGSKAATLATQSSLDEFQAVVSGSLLLSHASLTTLQTSANNLNGKVDALQIASQSGLDAAAAKLDVAVSSRASQASLDDFTTNQLVTLTSNTLTRASQMSVDSVNTALVTANGKLDATMSSRASQSSLDAANSKLNFGLDANMLSRASQVGMDSAIASLTAANVSIGVLDGKLNNRLDSAVSSRAAQGSVDTAISGIGTANLGLSVITNTLNFGLDTNMVSRASQNSLNTLSNNVAMDTDLLLRARIEQQLTDGMNRVSLFYLPAINAGHLEFVRDIVAETIQRNIDAATMTSKNTTKALNSLAAGNAAFASKQYKAAYDSYVIAYQAAVQ